MVLGHHVIFGTYGFWLPNDPRGSWSDFVGSWELFRFGKATKVTARHSLARVNHDAAHRRTAKQALMHPEVHFTGQQALEVAHGFREAAEEAGYLLLACAILPEHVHLVVAQHERNIGRIVGHLKARATQRLHELGWPADAPVWADRCWKVFLNDSAAVERAIAYVAHNPIKERKPRQKWSFVIPYDLI